MVDAGSEVRDVLKTAGAGSDDMGVAWEADGALCTDADLDCAETRRRIIG